MSLNPEQHRRSDELTDDAVLSATLSQAADNNRRLYDVSSMAAGVAWLIAEERRYMDAWRQWVASDSDCPGARTAYFGGGYHG